MFKKLIDYIKERDKLKIEVEALKDEKIKLEKHNWMLHSQSAWFEERHIDAEIQYEKELKNHNNKKVADFISKVVGLIDKLEEKELNEGIKT